MLMNPEFDIRQKLADSVIMYVYFVVVYLYLSAQNVIKKCHCSSNSKWKLMVCVQVKIYTTMNMLPSSWWVFTTTSEYRHVLLWNGSNWTLLTSLIFML